MKHQLLFLCLLIGVLVAGCVNEQTVDVPTLAALPTASPTPDTASATPTEETPTLTPSPTETAFILYTPRVDDDDLVSVYDCPAIDCGVIAALHAGDEVRVIESDDQWHIILMEDDSTAYVQFVDLRPLITATETPTPTATRTPSRTRTPSVTPTGTISRTPTATRTPSPTLTATGSRTAIPTLRIPGTAIPTLALIGTVVVPRSGMIEGTPPTATPRPRIIPGGATQPVAPTHTPSYTPSATSTWTLAAPPTQQTMPPTIATQQSNPTQQPGGSTPPPGAFNTATPTQPGGPPPPGGGSPPPSGGGQPPTSGAPPGLPPPPPGS